MPRADDHSAERWAIRLDSDALTNSEQSELDDWLAADDRRAGALLRAQAALAYLDRGRALGSLDVGSEPAPRFARRGVIAAMVGSGLAAAISAFAFWPPGGQDYQTAVGEVRRIPLADGSTATINTQSYLTVAMTEAARTVHLEKGEAWFRVAHNKTRPFIVEAGDIRVRAVGTAFSVRRRKGGVDVLVTEGVVETWVVGRESDAKRIGAGARGFVPVAAGGIEVASAPQEIDRSLSWRSGELALDGENLGYAIEEINRYNQRQLVIEDPSLAREQLVGYFRTNEPENFARAVAGMVGAKVVSDGDKIRLVRSAE